MSELSDKERPDKDLPDEQQLEDYLRGGSDVSRQYRQLHSAEVPAELDQLVLRQAQDAVKARPAKSRTWTRWAGPLALAASAVLVVSIVIESGVHEETYVAVPASAPADMKARQEVAEQTAKRNATEERAVVADEATDKAADSDASVVHIPPAQPAPVPEMNIKVPEPSISLKEPPPVPEFFGPAEPSPASANPQFASPPREESAAERLSQPAPRAPANAITRTRARPVVPAPAPIPIPVPAQESVAPEVSLREEDTSVQEVAVTGMKRPERRQTAGPRNTIAAPTAGDSAGNAAEQEDEPRNYSEPEQWLRDIRQLRKENKHAEADREWRRFRYVFPNYQVAEDDSARGATR